MGYTFMNAMGFWLEVLGSLFVLLFGGGVALFCFEIVYAYIVACEPPARTAPPRAVERARPTARPLPSTAPLAAAPTPAVPQRPLCPPPRRRPPSHTDCLYWLVVINKTEKYLKVRTRRPPSPSAPPACPWLSPSRAHPPHAARRTPLTPPARRRSR